MSCLYFVLYLKHTSVKRHESNGHRHIWFTKEHTRILRPIVCHSPYHIRNTKDFVAKVKNIKLEEGECITSHDVKVVYMSVTVYPANNIIKNKLEQDAELPNRTSMSIPAIIALLGFCLKNTLFLLLTLVL